MLILYVRSQFPSLWWGSTSPSLKLSNTNFVMCNCLIKAGNRRQVIFIMSEIVLNLADLQSPGKASKIDLERAWSALIWTLKDFLRILLKDLADMELLLKDVDLLSGLARLPPKGACARRPAPSTTNSTWPLNTTMWARTRQTSREKMGPRGQRGSSSSSSQGAGKTQQKTLTLSSQLLCSFGPDSSRYSVETTGVREK